MFFCAFIIERSSVEYYFRPRKPSKIYWLQPGGQKVGDQVFDAFLAVREGSNGCSTKDLVYIKSLRSPQYRGSDSLLFVAVMFTTAGFVLQFVGLRGLHASVTLALLGSTLVMAIIRTCLRTQRMDESDNLLTNEERRLTSCNKQELDCFAFHLENVKSFRVLARSVNGSSTTQSEFSSCETLIARDPPTTMNSECLGRKVVKTRAHLAALTDDHGVAWDNLPIRKIAQNLKETIEATMELLSCWSNKRLDTYRFWIRIECQSLDERCSPTIEPYPIQLQRMGDTLRWTVDSRELEAVLGLWTWSLLKSDEGFRPGQPLSRLIGQDPKEAMKEETDLYYHKWIFRQKEARMVAAKMIPASHELFGCHLDNLSNDMEILVMKTENQLDTMAAQDLYIHFLNSALEILEELGGEIDILPSSRNSFVAHNSRIEELAQCFEINKLGSREDALLCIVPALKRKGLLPELSADSSAIRQRVERYIENGEWKEALSMLRWLCERSEGAEFEHSVVEFGYLCRRAMLHSDPDICREGVEQVLTALRYDFRLQYFRTITNPRPPGWMNSPLRSELWSRFAKELGWLAWHISKGRPEQKTLEDYGVREDSIITGVVDGNPDLAQRGQLAVLQWLAKSDDAIFERDVPGEDDQLALDWVFQNNYDFLLQWLMIRWAEVGVRSSYFLRMVLVWAAKSQSESAIQVLRRHDIDINATDGGQTALMHVVMEGDEKAVRKLLENGADAKAGAKTSRETPLMLAAREGHKEIAELLLEHGADLESQDYFGGLSALNWAAKNNHLDVVQLLLAKGANIETTGADGRTPLLHAASENYPEMVSFLLENGADVNVQDDNGHTALVLAVQRNLEDIVVLLLEHKADIYKKDISGYTALDWATSLQHRKIMSLLEAVM